MVQQQQQEVEKAVIGCGKYRIRAEYDFLSVTEDKWFQMTQAERLQKLKNFNTCSVRSGGQTGEVAGQGTEQTSTQCDHCWPVQIGRCIYLVSSF